MFVYAVMLHMSLKAVPSRARSRLLFCYIVPLLAVHHGVHSCIQLLDAVSSCRWLCIIISLAALHHIDGGCVILLETVSYHWHLCIMLLVVSSCCYCLICVIPLYAVLCHISYVFGGCITSCGWMPSCFWKLCIVSMTATSHCFMTQKSIKTKWIRKKCVKTGALR